MDSDKRAVEASDGFSAAFARLGRASVVAILAAFPANRISRVHKLIDPTTAEA